MLHELLEACAHRRRHRFVPELVPQCHGRAIGLQESPAVLTVGQVPGNGVPRLGIQGLLHVREEEVHHLPTAELQREARSRSRVSPGRGAPRLECRYLSCPVRHAAVRLHASQASAWACHSPRRARYGRVCTVSTRTRAQRCWSLFSSMVSSMSSGQGGSQAPRPLDQSHDGAPGCDARGIG